MLCAIIWFVRPASDDTSRMQLWKCSQTVYGLPDRKQGNYQQYLETKKEEPEEVIIEEKETSKKEVKQKPKSNTSLIRKVEKEIDNLEKKIKVIETEMLDEKVYNDYLKMNELQTDLNKLNEELDEKLIEWENLNT